MEVIRNWFKRYFSDPQVVILITVLVVSFVVILAVGDLVAPVLTSIVVAYLLQGPIKLLEKMRVPGSLALIIVFLCFIVLMVLTLVWLVPTMIEEVRNFIKALPSSIDKIKTGITAWVGNLDIKNPSASSEQAGTIIDNINSEITKFGTNILASSWDWIKILINAIVFVVLMPMLVYFFLKDKKAILEWMRRFYPQNMELTNTVWYELNEQIGNYIRGKIFEVLLVWVVTYVAFLSFGLENAFLLAGMVGLSALIPYIGAVVVTIPVVISAYTGFLVPDSGLPDYSSFWGVIIVFLVIQAVDGVVVVPLLFSEVVKLHPIAIVMAVLVFGGIWGFWGVFFAIPLASLVQAILNSWPRTKIVAPDNPTA